MKVIVTSFGLALLTVGLARAGEPAKPAPPKEDKVNPAAYRILVKHDQYTLDMIRDEIRQEVRRSLEARARRLKLSREEVEELLKKELGKFGNELEAVEKAQKEETTARGKGDLTEAEKWRLLRLERARNALDLAQRARLIEEALVSLSAENWRDARQKERMIADKALERLEAMLKEVQKKEEAEPRDAGIFPPHE